MKKFIRLIVLFELAGLALLAVASNAQGNGNPRPKFGADLQGRQEVPAILSSGRGKFRAQVTSDGSAIDYTIRYSGLGVVDHAHIHIGQRGANGGVAVFLCSPCADNADEFSGTIISADVLGV